ncbi:Bromodomain-containing protein [Obba rivulosa]|uniref:Bromodomain-containing protein n=1 Tax=Obba rivulosa TaxID=1052685 RepID=A0A8E2ARJ5_9APHY|nr:Bromodomain-containing protein [Obba rivulosa]
MSKREASILGGGGIDIDAPRAKRRKEAVSSSPPKDHANGTGAAPSATSEAEGAAATVTVKEDAGEVKEKGLKLWHTVKDAVNKEGRVLSHDFMRLPSKRQYPDYYEIIKRPISLDEIKVQLDAEAYTSLEDVKKDLETCFRNAKRYNIRESQIFKDAKHLHKLAIKEYNKMTGRNEDAGDPDHEGEGDHAGGSDDEPKKKKGTSMNRLLKTRLQKLVEKTDDEGRVLSHEFMELPNRKLWPLYYKIIKKPQCLEVIFKKLKRKEYHTAADFANDVELVFSNALEFNQEHTEIWNDAVTLKDYFRQLMSDLPEPHTVPAYTSTPTGRIKFKVPAPSGHLTASPSIKLAAPTPTPAATHVASSSQILTLRPPAQASAPNGVTQPSPSPGTAKSPAVTSNVPPAASPPTAVSSRPSTSSTPAVPPVLTAQSAYTNNKAPAATTAATAGAANYSQLAYAAPFSQHYPNATYHSPGAPAPATTTAAAQSPAVQSPVNNAAAVPAQTPAASQSPAPSTSQKHRQPKHVLLTTYPLGRRLPLDQSDGVRTWAVRLGAWETAVYVSGVETRGREQDEESGDEEPERREEEEEEEEAQPVPEVQEPPKKRGRGRPRKHPIEPPPAPVPEKPPAPAQEAQMQVKKGKGKATQKTPVPEEVQLKLNGVVLKEREDAKGTWVVDVPLGTSVLEVGEKGGVAWKVYMERLGT